MASTLYGKGREAFANGSIDWVNDDIRAILIDEADYTVDIDVHDFLDDIPAGARVSVTAASLANKTNVLGVCDADDGTFSAVTGDVSEAIVLYKHTGSDATSQLIVYLDDADTTGLPVIPNTGDINFAFDNGADRVFKL